MSDWERYAHTEAPDRFIQLAILHPEFEALHPFLDGNGRLGRMLVPLFLWQMGLIHRPMFYISAFFDANRDEYYDRLLAVSRDGDWTGCAGSSYGPSKRNLKRTSSGQGTSCHCTSA